jgi:hypothetical protein
VVAALILGRRLVREPRSVYLAFLVGWIILRLADLVPVLGNIVTVVATVYGLGALTVAAWRAARGHPVRPAPTPGDQGREGASTSPTSSA